MDETDRPLVKRGQGREDWFQDDARAAAGVILWCMGAVTFWVAVAVVGRVVGWW